MPFDSNYMNDDQVKAAIEASFSPMNTVVQFSPYRHSVGFLVEDPETGKSWRMDRVLMRRARQKDRLRELILRAREHIRWKGGSLDPLDQVQ